MLHTKRVLASRHCLTCRQIKPRQELEGQHLGKMEVLFCCGHPPKHSSETDSPCEKIPSSYLPRLLLYGPCKVLIIALFIFYLGLSIWGASQIKVGFKLENAVPDTSSLAQYLKERNIYFTDNGPPVMFVVEEPVNYRDFKNVDFSIHAVLKRARESQYVKSDFEISWLDSYRKYLVQNNKDDEVYREEELAQVTYWNNDTEDDRFLRVLREEFFARSP